MRCASLLLISCALAAGEPRPAPGGPWSLDIPQVPRDQVIAFTLYTLSRGTLKLTAQLLPLQAGEPRTVALETQDGEAWKPVAEAPVIERGWTATFRVPGWDATRDHRFRVRHGPAAAYAGRIRRDPVDKPEIVVAAFTGNSNTDRGPRSDLIANVAAHDPDLLFFAGDQVYDHGKHYAAWLLFGRQFGELMRDRPTVTLPDDHDVGQGNLWGSSGKKAAMPGGDDGGYTADAAFVKEVERAQTAHLPDPVDATPIQQGIGCWFTAMNVGGIGFAIIEDRKFKTGPAEVLPKMGPRFDHITDPAYDVRKADVPGAVLLGERQERFLRAWAGDWQDQTMKAVLSATIFCNAAHEHGRLGGRLIADLDANGWPQSGRNRALAEIRRGFAVMIAGDQHLGTVIHHGIDGWNDAGWSFCVPSIVNYYNRWWRPAKPGANPPSGGDDGLGEFLDPLGNRITMRAYANPTVDNLRAAGHGIVRFRKAQRQITFECWPRGVDVRKPDARQFAGWPVTVDQLDNYARPAAAWLPLLRLPAAEQVVQVAAEPSGELVYALRVAGREFQPRVFAPGTYTVVIGEGARIQRLTGLAGAATAEAAGVREVD